MDAEVERLKKDLAVAKATAAAWQSIAYGFALQIEEMEEVLRERGVALPSRSEPSELGLPDLGRTVERMGRRR